MKKSVPKLIALIGCFLYLFFSNASAEEPIRIMPLGDSITRGWYGSPGANGYRKPLYLSLTNHGYNVDFVGCKNDGDFADKNHEGRDGWHAAVGTTGGILPNVYNWLTAKPADIVLLHIGTNDITAGGQDANEVDDILDEIDRYDPDITVVLALIINRKSYSSITTQYNNSLNQMAMNRIANGDDIIIVNMENALNYSTDMADNLHPNDSGYAKMADVWFTALDNLLGIPPAIVSAPVTTAVAQQLYTYDVNTCGYPDPNCELIVCPEGMTIDANTGVIEWTPATTGDFDVIVKASNGLIPDANQAFTVSVSPIIEFDSASDANAQDSNTLSWSHTIGSGNNRILVVGAAGKDANSADLEISSVLYDNVPMNLVVGSARTAGSNPHIKTELYYLPDESLPETPGSYNVVVTYDGSVNEACVGAVSLKNVGQGPPEAVATNAQSGSNSISTDIATLTNCAYVVDVVGSDTSGTLSTAAEDMIQRWHQAATSSSAAMSTRAVDVAGTVTNSWSHTAIGQLAQSAIALPAAGRIISGYIQEPNKIPISGVLVSAEQSICDGMTDPNGYYQLTVPYGWSKTVIPTKTNCTFHPAQKTYDNVITNQANQNYTNIETYDLDDDGSIGYGDIAVMRYNWLDNPVGKDCDFDDNANVNFKDYAEFANVWLTEYGQ